MGKEEDLKLSFLTWNIYIGADFTPFLGGITPQEVTEVLRQFLATNFPIRAKAIARAIASKKPNLIGLQEADRIQLVIPNVKVVTYDFIELLLEALEEEGLHYKLAIFNENRNLSGIPDSHGNTINFLDRDAILIRKNQELKVINKQAENFTTNLPGFLRGWSLVDVKLDGQVFRMVNTHLEPLSSAVRVAQATELINGPANTNLPVIITGDFNDTPGSATYQVLVNAGFHDVWQEVGEGNGFTCCQDSDLLNAVSSLNLRIDYVWFRGGWEPKKAELLGESQNDRTKTGLWPSDHAGVWAKLELEDEHD